MLDSVVSFISVSYFAGSNVSAYVGMVNEALRTTIPKAVVHCQVREAKRSLLDMFYTRIGKIEVRVFEGYELLLLIVGSSNILFS